MYLRTLDAQGEREYFHALKVVTISGWQTNEFTHPGLLVSEAELDTIKENIQINGHPMRAAWNSFNPSSTYQPEYGGWEVVNMKNPTHKTAFLHDGHKLTDLAVKWAIGGEARYADAALRIMNAWAGSSKQWWVESINVYPFLTITHWMHDWTVAAEILRDYKGGYSGWSQADRTQYDKFVRDVLVPVSLA